MDIKKLDFRPSTIFKIAGLAVVAVIVVVAIFRFIGSSFYSIVKQHQSLNLPMFDVNYGKMNESAVYNDMKLSIRNVASVKPSNSTGNNAEDFEVKEYYALIETRKLDDDCAKINSLKARADVIFENVNSYDKGCDFIFKVKKETVVEILEIIKSLEPKELQEKTFTIKNQIEDFTGEINILNKKLASIDETLNVAVAAYNEVTRLATTTRDVESLAKIIDSKINLIERLTSERLQVSNRLEEINRTKTIQLDRVNYIYFNVKIYENKFIDWENLKDSWKAATQEFIRDLNQIAQNLSINLASILFYVFEILIYCFLFFVIAKYVWKLAKYIWTK